MHHLLNNLAEEYRELFQAQANLVEAIEQVVLGHVLENSCFAAEDGREMITNSAGKLHIDSVSMCASKDC